MIPNIKNELVLLVNNDFGLAIALKKWYTGAYNVILVRTSSRKYYMQGFEGTIKHKDNRDEILIKFDYLGRWTHKMVSNEIKKLGLNYPMRITRKY